MPKFAKTFREKAGHITGQIFFTSWIRSGARVAEEARLESVYTPKAYRGFESPSLRKEHVERQRIEALIQRVLSFFSPGNDIKKNRKTAENSREKPKNAEVCTQHARKF